MNLTLARTDQSEQCTLGLLRVADAQFFSIEQPWRDNEIGHSCVPPGLYELVPYDSPVHGTTWCLHNPALNIFAGIPPEGGRAYCEIHSANFASQLQGCIALGTALGAMKDPQSGENVSAVYSSRAALSELVGILGAMSRGHTLAITEAQQHA